MHRISLISIVKHLTYFKNQIVAIPQQVIFSTVRDTHEYHKFIPWCKGSQILKTISQVENYTQLTISFNNIKEISYTSHVLIEYKQQSQTITSICKDSPLKYLKSIWKFQKHNHLETNISYFLDFQFDSVLYQLTSSIFLNTMGKSMMEIFLKRAMQRYNLQKAQQLEQKGQKILKSKDQIQPSSIKTGQRLEQYLESRPLLKNIMKQNQQISQQILLMAKRLSETSNYSQKMNFQIKNMLTHHNIHDEIDLFKQLQ